MSRPIRIAIVEDDRRYAESLRNIFQSEPGLECANVFMSGEETLRKLKPGSVDLIIVDLELPGLSGLDLLPKLRKIHPNTALLVLTQFNRSEKIFSAIRAGAIGYLLKRSSFSAICSAIFRLQAGDAPMSPEIARKVVKYFQSPECAAPAVSLTGREEEVLKLLAKGLANKEIAVELAVSIDTIRAHLRQIYEKLKVHSRTQAAVKYLSGSIVRSDDESSRQY